MAFVKVDIHKIDLDGQKEIFRRYAPNESEYKKVLEHLRLLSIGEITGRPIGEKRQSKLLDMFTLFFKNYKKPTDKITKKDLEKFKEDLLNNKILKENGNPYSDETKEDCTETIVRYIECSYPEKASLFISSTGKPFKKWFVIRASKKTPETISEGELEKLYNSCKSLDGKFLLAVLFDAGCRIEEFLNIRFEDIQEPSQNFPYYKIDFKEEYSKTEGRVIGLYWKHSTEAINKYLQTCEKKDMKEQVFKKDYDAVRMFLLRMGKKVLSKRVTPHTLRKSSATHYADKLNRQQLCIRYGWQFSSTMPDIYISRKGVNEERVKEVLLNDDLNVIKKENQELKIKTELSQKEIEKLKNTLEKQQGEQDLAIKKQIDDYLAKLMEEREDYANLFIERMQAKRKN